MTVTLDIQILPFEIIELIALFTTKQDLLQVMRVSKAWYHSFHAFLYQSITIDTVKKQHTILNHFRRCQPSLYHVRQLELRHIQLSTSDISTITKIFPDIDTLVIDWSIWDSLLKQMEHSPYYTRYRRSSVTDTDANPILHHIHPVQGLPPIVRDFFQFYGSRKLKHLTLDTSPPPVPHPSDNSTMSSEAAATANFNTSSVDVWSILELCPRLKTLRLDNLNYEHLISMGYLEIIHQYCPLLTSLSIKCARCDSSPHLLPQYNTTHSEDDIENYNGRIVLQPTILEFFSLSSKAGCAKWANWLPYFSVKYPHLQHLMFKHRGLGKDGGGYSRLSSNAMVPQEIFDMFVRGCRKLKSIHWNKIIVQPDQLNSLFSCYNKTRKDMLQRRNDSKIFSIDQSQLQRVEAYGFLHYMGKNNSLYLNLLTSLTIGQPPANYTPSQVIETIGQQCQNLMKLRIQECFCDPEIAYPIDTILTHCKRLKTLSIKDTHLVTSTTSTPSPVLAQHPLKKLFFKRTSFIGSVFPTIASCCPYLSHVELLGCVQTDRRDQIRIALPYQHLTTLKVQGLRTRHYYSGCRIRFFHIVDHSISTEQQHHWHYMTQYDVRNHPVGHKLCFQKYRQMEYAQHFDPLYTTIEEQDDDIDDVQLASMQRRKSSCIIQELIESLAMTDGHGVTAVEQQETQQQGQQNAAANRKLKAWDIQQLVKKTTQHATVTMMIENWEPESIYYSGFAHLEFASVKDLYINQKKLCLS